MHRVTKVLTAYSASTIVTLAMPPPSHMVCSPKRLPRAQRVDQRGHQLGARRAERMAERDRAAVDVEPGGVGAELRSQASGTGAKASLTS